MISKNRFTGSHKFGNENSNAVKKGGNQPQSLVKFGVGMVAAPTQLMGCSWTVPCPSTPSRTATVPSSSEHLFSQGSPVAALEWRAYSAIPTLQFCPWHLQDAHKAAMALAATLRPKGKLRSVMASTILGLDIVEAFTNSETCPEEKRTSTGHSGDKQAWAERLLESNGPISSHREANR